MMKLSIVYSWCWYLFKLNVCVCLFDACLIGDACPYLHASEAVSKPVSYVRPLAELPPSDTLSKLAARPKNRAVEDKVSGVGGHVVARVCSYIALLCRPRRCWHRRHCRRRCRLVSVSAPSLLSALPHVALPPRPPLNPLPPTTNPVTALTRSKTMTKITKQT